MELKEAVISVLEEYLDNDDKDMLEEMAIEITERMVTLNPYAKGYALLMEYWDSIPDDDKPAIDEQLRGWGL